MNAFRLPEKYRSCILLLTDEAFDAVQSVGDKLDVFRGGYVSADRGQRQFNR